MRESILSLIPDESLTKPLAKAPIIDQVFLSGAYKTEYNDTNPINTEGNTHNSTDDLYNWLLAQSGTSAQALGGSSGTSSSSSSISDSVSRGGGNSTSRRILRAFNSRHAARGLSLDLLADSKLIGSDPSQSPHKLSLQFNILTSTREGANKLAEIVKKWTAEDSALLRRDLQSHPFSLAAAKAINSTYPPFLVSNVTGVTVITLTYTRSFWQIFLDFLVRNIINVIAGSIAISMFVAMLMCWRRFMARCKENRVAAKKQRLKDELDIIKSAVRRALTMQRWKRALFRVRILAKWIARLNEMRQKREDEAFTSQPSERGAFPTSPMASSTSAAIAAVSSTSSRSPSIAAFAPSAGSTGGINPHNIAQVGQPGYKLKSSRSSLAKHTALALIGARALSVKRGEVTVQDLKQASQQGLAVAEQALRQRRPSLFSNDVVLPIGGKTNPLAIKRSPKSVGGASPVNTSGTSPGLSPVLKVAGGSGGAGGGQTSFRRVVPKKPSPEPL